MYRPRPSPGKRCWVALDPRPNGSKMRSCSPGSSPMPSSAMVKHSPSTVQRRRVRISVPGAEYLTALFSKLSTTCSSRPASTPSRAGRSGISTVTRWPAPGPSAHRRAAASTSAATSDLDANARPTTAHPRDIEQIADERFQAIGRVDDALELGLCRGLVQLPLRERPQRHLRPTLDVRHWAAQLV